MTDHRFIDTFLDEPEPDSPMSVYEASRLMLRREVRALVEERDALAALGEGEQ